MDHLHVREGSLLDEGELLTTLSDNSQMWVYFNVPEAEYLNYFDAVQGVNHQKVTLLMANGKEFEYPGIVETIEGEFNNETGNIAFRATFPNPNGKLRHGETGSILMRIDLNHALIIPQKATFQILDKNYVFVLDKENVVRQREITIAAELPHLFAIGSGLTASDRIILEGIRMVHDGESVTPDFVSPQQVLSNLELYAE
jgi:membrane fusion protein (multidrug efflux system)